MAALNAEIKRYNNRPCIHLNGEPVNPYMYAITDTPGARWSWEELQQRQFKQFGECGVKLFQLQIWLEDIWEKGKPLNIELVQKQLQGVIDVDPEAAIMLRFHINAPIWWNKENPEECTEYCDGPAEYMPDEIGIRRYIIGDLDRRKLHSLSSLKWREETTAAIEEFCQRLSATKEAERLFSIQFCDGVSHEWHYWGFMAHEPDCSKPMTNYFRNWLKEKYQTDAALQDAWKDAAVTLETAEVPGMEYRNAQSESLFRDIEKERRVIDYYMAQQDSISDDIVYFAEVFKKNWPRKIIIGTFYGYFFTMFFRQAVGGHLNVDKVLDCPYLDFLSAPAAYSDETRGLGGNAMARGIQEACALRNKMWFTEMDQATNLIDISEIKNNSVWDSDEVRTFTEKTVPRDVSIIERNVMNITTKGSGFWYFDFGPMFKSGWWDYPDYMDAVKRLKDLSDASFVKEQKSNADVLTVFDTDSYYYTITGWTPIAQSSSDHIACALYKTGAMIDFCYLFDLDKIDFSQYKTVIFANCWRLDNKQREIINNKIKKDGRHVVWNYVTGYINEDDKSQSVANIADITGVNVEFIEGGYHPSIELTKDNMKEKINSVIEFNCDSIYPLPVVDDAGDNEVLGVYKEDEQKRAMLLKKDNGEYTSWYSSVMNINAEFYKHVFEEAGVHIYSETMDSFFGGNGYLVLHSNTPGKKKIVTKSGVEHCFEIDDAKTIIVEE